MTNDLYKERKREQRRGRKSQWEIATCIGAPTQERGEEEKEEDRKEGRRGRGDRIKGGKE